MPENEGASAAAPAPSLADLHLPPTFVADHGIRTLFYQGAMSPVELGRHWRVHQDIAFELVEGMKTAGLVEYEAKQTTFERHGKVHLTVAGQARVASARQRTWYAGAFPVSLSDLAQRMHATESAFARDAYRDAMAEFGLSHEVVDQLGQALAAGASVITAGLAPDEEAEVAAALGAGLAGDCVFPHALFASGQVFRVFDRRYHRPARAENAEPSILRDATPVSPWANVARPKVTLAGGVFESDALPAYDDEARFYLMPGPFAASGGVLSVLSADSAPEGLLELARLWLVPGRDGTGIIMLRTGERLEVPWRAATALFCATSARVPAQVRDAVSYHIDASALDAAGLDAFVRRRLRRDLADAAPRIGEAIAAARISTRTDAAAVLRQIRDHALYGGTTSVSEDGIRRAIGVVARDRELETPRLHVA